MLRCFQHELKMGCWYQLLPPNLSAKLGEGNIHERGFVCESLLAYERVATAFELVAANRGAWGLARAIELLTCHLGEGWP